MSNRTHIFLASRLFGRRASADSRMGVRFALLGIVISVVVMVVSLCVVIGFKQTITERVAAYSAHIRVVSFDNNATYEMNPIDVPDSMLSSLSSIPHVASATPFLTKPAILKTDSAVRGVVLIARDTLAATTDLILSRRLANRLGAGDSTRLYAYFVGESLRVRRLTVVDTYDTGFAEGDDLFAWVHPNLIRQLNGWRDDQASGVQVMVDDLAYLHTTADQVYFATANRLDDGGRAYFTETLDQLNPQIFAWLDLLDMNVAIILLLMMIVAGFSMVSALIILILDSVTTVGTLKALGAGNRLIRRTFLTEGLFLVVRGLVYGYALGIGICVIQYCTHFIPLDPTSYYVNFVPVSFPIPALILLAFGVTLISLIILILPTSVATHISPARVMRYD